MSVLPTGSYPARTHTASCPTPTEEFSPLGDCVRGIGGGSGGRTVLDGLIERCPSTLCRPHHRSSRRRSDPCAGTVERNW